jgi:hypothetical protein
VKTLLAVVVLLSCLATAGARADATPSPARPEWDHTPVPMPTGPPEDVRALALMAIGVAAGALVLARRERA